MFIIIPYDYKNRIEKLCSTNFDGIKAGDDFIIPDEVVLNSDSGFKHFGNKKNVPNDFESNYERPVFKCRVSKSDYINNAKSILKHIHEGDVYELNYCIEFYVEEFYCDPFVLFQKLSKKMEAPFSGMYRFGNKYLLLSTPERYLKKSGSRLESQPMKGTIKRSPDPETDNGLKHKLYNDPKERNENVMIVDMVRNDLSKVAEKGSVKVDELFGIYSFKHVHQMVSTVSCNLKSNIDFRDIIHATFPMGSMTGAPKVKAMELIEKYEVTKRGLYSGAVGYIDEEGNFDLAVVIRSLSYNAETGYLSFMVGSAITAQCDPVKEYEECLLKAEPLIQVIEEIYVSRV